MSRPPPSAQSQLSVIETVRSAGHGTQSIMGSVMGTPAYMPPEQARGDVDADGRAKRRVRARRDPVRDPDRATAVRRRVRAN